MKSREKVLALVTGAVVFLAVGVSLLEPALDRWRELEDERLQLEESLERSRALSERLSELRLERAALDARLSSVEGEAVVPGIVALVRDLSRQAGFEPTSLRFLRASPLGKGDNAGPFAELRFDLRARLSLKQLNTFCVLLAASERPIRVVSLALNPRAQGGGLEGSLSLVALAPADELAEGAR